MLHITVTPQRLTLSAVYIYEKDLRVRSRNFQRPEFYYKFTLIKAASSNIFTVSALHVPVIHVLKLYVTLESSIYSTFAVRVCIYT